MRIAPKPKPGQEISIYTLLGEKPPPKPKPPIGETKVLTFKTNWVMSPVSLRDGLYEYDLQRGMIDYGSEASLEEWMRFAQKAEGARQYIPAAGDVVYAIADFLHQHIERHPDDAGAKEAWKYLSDRLRFQNENRFQTFMFTKCIYYPDGQLDEVIQEPGLCTEVVKTGMLYGPQGRLCDLSDRNLFAWLTLGTKAGAKAHDLLSELCEKPLYVGRHTSPPRAKDINNLLIGTAPGGNLLITTNKAQTHQYALGVRQRKRLDEEMEDDHSP